MEFFGRINQLVTSLGPQFAVLAGIGVIVLAVTLFTLAITGKRKALLLCLVLCMPFAGFMINSVDATATLLRWAMMFALAISCVAGIRSPGPSNLLLGVFGLLTLAVAPISQFPLIAIQFSVLWITMTWLVSSALASEIRDLPDINAVLKILLVGAGLFVLLGISQIPSFRGGTRFAGTSTGAPVFVITGGLLLPVALWSALHLRQAPWRIYAGGVAITIAALTVFSGQRTGTLAGFIACVPVVMSFSLRRIPIVVAVVAAVVVAVVVIFALFPDQAAFAAKRFLTLDVTGREIRWRQGWEICLEEPLLPHGIRSRVDFHNGYLEAWYRGGFVGLMLVVSALATVGWQSWKLCMARSHKELAAIGRLSLGILLFVLVSSMPEDKLISPSNMTIFMTMLFGVIAARGNAILRQQRRSAARTSGAVAD